MGQPGERGGVGGGRLSIDVLGPIQVRDAEGRDVTPDGTLQRRLLAMLVLRRGRVVSVDTAIDVLWPLKPPRDPVAALHNHVFRLRRGLPVDVVESIGDGYRLIPTAVDLDAERLAVALQADPSDPAAAATIDELLERWHGSAYPELDDVDDGRAESIRLGELRLRAREVRAERRINAGDTDGIVAEVAELAEAEPLRERPRSLHMAALAATGRTVEALRVYDDFRRLLGDELGIEPSPALCAQHAELLRGTEPVRWTPATKLPVAVTSLIGRDQLLAEVTGLAESHRLVTLLGPGGVGKTRLLVEIGRRLRTASADRAVVMCELATAGAESAVDLVAATLGIEGRVGIGLAERVADMLADTEVVLLLDNCEHVLDPIAGLVERILGTCPDVTVVTTSRERLRVAGEHLVVVPTLPHAAGNDPAVRLFLERARAVAPGFQPTRRELLTVAEIVRRLDGLPLAIELAAARMHTLDVDEVAAGLDRRYLLQSPGVRTATRHASLNAAISWSVDLLDSDLRRTFVDLSVFVGPFTVEDAAAICDIELDPVGVALEQLVERSLVRRSSKGRYALLETLRAFGAESLVATGRAAEVGERHARYHLAWTAAAEQAVWSNGHDLDMVAIDDKLPDLRAALAWMIDHDDAERAGRLVSMLRYYGVMRLRPDVLAWAERVSDADPDDRSPFASDVWAVASDAAWMAGDVTEATARAGRALRVCERQDREISDLVAQVAANAALFEGRLADSVAWYRRAVELARDNPVARVAAASSELLALGYGGDPSVVERAEAVLREVGDDVTPVAAYARYCSGEALLSLDVELAHTRLAHALELAELTHASFVAGIAGSSKASIESRVGDPDVAAADYRWLIAHWRRAGMWSTQWTTLRSVVGLLVRLGRYRQAAVLEGAVRAPNAGHRIFGDDEVRLAELGAQLRAELGDSEYESARAEGAALDGNGAIEHALRAL